MLSASGVGASGSPKPTNYNFKTAHNTATKITQHNALIFPASKHNLIDTMTLFHVTVASYGWIYWQNPNSIKFSPQSEEYLKSKVSDKIKKLANALIIFNNISDVLMTSFIIKDPPRFFPFVWKTPHMFAFFYLLSIVPVLIRADAISAAYCCCFVFHASTVYRHALQLRSFPSVVILCKVIIIEIWPQRKNRNVFSTCFEDTIDNTWLLV